MHSFGDGTTVVLTRQPEHNATLAAALRETGAVVLELPCVRTVALDDPTELSSAIRSLRSIDLLVLTSRAGARAVGAAAGGMPLSCGVAVVGEATAREALALSIPVSFVASSADGSTLGRELPLPAGEVLLARSDLADPELPEILRARGARVREIVAYRTVARIDGDAQPVVRAIGSGRTTFVVASPSAVGALATLGRYLLMNATFVAIGPRTAARVREIVGARVIVASRTDPAAIVSAIRSACEEVPA